MGIKHQIFNFFKPLLQWGYVRMEVPKIAEENTYPLEKLPEGLKYCLVLGAKVGNEMQPLLEERLRTVLKVHERFPKMIFILSGTPKHDEYPSDVVMMRDYLRGHGHFAKEQLVEDYRGTSTFYSLKSWFWHGRSRSLGIITNAFHLPRALFIAVHLGLHPYGVQLPPRPDGESRRYYEDRELAATYKALLQCVFIP